MSGLFKSPAPAAAPAPPTPAPPPTMPDPFAPAALEARRLQMQRAAGSAGRSSTILSTAASRGTLAAGGAGASKLGA